VNEQQGGVPGKSRSGRVVSGTRPLAKLMSDELKASEVIVADVSVQLIGTLSRVVVSTKNRAECAVMVGVCPF